MRPKDNQAFPEVGALFSIEILDFFLRKFSFPYLCPPNFKGSVVQSVRMPPCHGGGRGFESRPVRKSFGNIRSFFVIMSRPPSFQRTRYAPTPSGYLHLGNIVSFVLTAGIAQRYGASILLRIDDLDAERMRPAYLADIFETLAFLDLPWHEGPRTVQQHKAHFSQQYRLQHYHAALQALRQQSAVFACSCSRSQLALFPAAAGYPGLCANRQLSFDTPGVAWRIKTAAARSQTMHLPSGRATVHSFPPSMQGFMVRGKYGAPAYQLASVVDDVLMGVDLIVRGTDLFPSSLAQLYLASCFETVSSFQQTAFLHHPLLRNSDGVKLSKSAGATSVQGMRQQGCTPADVFSEAARLCGIHERVATWQELYAHLRVQEGFQFEK